MNKRLLAFYLLVGFCIVGLTYFVANYPISGFDHYMTMEIQEQRGLDLSFVMKFISIFGNAGMAPISVIIAALLFYLTYHRREACFTFAVIIPDALNMLIKILIHRPRPSLEEAKILLKFTQSGFPSGHVVHYVVFFGFLLTVMIVDKEISLFWRIVVGSLALFLILTVSISRVYLGAHWTTDVMGGYLFGIIYLGVILKYYLLGRGSKNPTFFADKAQKRS